MRAAEMGIMRSEHERHDVVQSDPEVAALAVAVVDLDRDLHAAAGQ